MAETRATHFDKKEPGTRIASRLSLVERVVGFDWLKRELLISIKKEPGTRTASRLSLVERVVGFDWLKRELLISIKKEPGTRIASRLSLIERVVGFDWLKRELLISIKKEPGTRTASRLSLVEKGGRFRLAETRATHFDKKRAWNANCVQTQSGGGDGGIRTHVPISGQNDFESFSLRPLRYISKSKRRTI